MALAVALEPSKNTTLRALNVSQKEFAGALGSAACLLSFARLFYQTSIKSIPNSSRVSNLSSTNSKNSSTSSSVDDSEESLDVHTTKAKEVSSRELLDPEDAANGLMSGEQVVDSCSGADDNRTSASDCATAEAKCALNVLSICGATLTRDTASLLSGSLKYNDHLTSLLLYGHNGGLLSTVAIADMLQVNRTLTALDLGDGKCGPEGAFALVRALLANPDCSLQRIYFYSNDIGDSGALVFARLLAPSSVWLSASSSPADAEHRPPLRHLTTLFLSNNDICDHGVYALAQSLRSNTVLEQLGLCRNNATSLGNSTSFTYPTCPQHTEH